MRVLAEYLQLWNRQMCKCKAAVPTFQTGIDHSSSLKYNVTSVTFTIAWKFMKRNNLLNAGTHTRCVQNSSAETGLKPSSQDVITYIGITTSGVTTLWTTTSQCKMRFRIISNWIQSCNWYNICGLTLKKRKPNATAMVPGLVSATMITALERSLTHKNLLMIYQEIWFLWSEIELSIPVKIKTVMMKSYLVHPLLPWEAVFFEHQSSDMWRRAIPPSFWTKF